VLTGGGGTEERDFVGARYGWKLGENTFARVYVKHFERDETSWPRAEEAGTTFT